MAATAESVQDKHRSGDSPNKVVETEKSGDKGLKKVLTQTKEQLDKLWTDAFGDLNDRLQTTESDIRDLVKRVETDGRERLTKILEAVKFERWAGSGAKELLAHPAKLRDELVEHGERLAQGSVSGLGLASEAQLSSLAAQVAKLMAANDSLAKRVKALESQPAKAAKTANAKKASPKKVAVNKAEAKKAAPKKAEAKKAAPKKAEAKKAAPKKAEASNLSKA